MVCSHFHLNTSGTDLQLTAVTPRDLDGRQQTVETAARLLVHLNAAMTGDPFSGRFTHLTVFHDD